MYAGLFVCLAIAPALSVEEVFELFVLSRIVTLAIAFAIDIAIAIGAIGRWKSTAFHRLVWSRGLGLCFFM